MGDGFRNRISCLDRADRNRGTYFMRLCALDIKKETSQKPFFYFLFRHRCHRTGYLGSNVPGVIARLATVI